jgi:MFS family permease
MPAVATVLLGLPASLAIPRLGYVRSLWVARGLAVAGLVLAAWAPSTGVVLAGLLGYGLGQVVMFGAAAPLLARLLPEEDRVSAYAWQAALTVGAGFLGNVVGGTFSSLLGGTGGVLLAAAAVLGLSVLPLLGLNAHGQREDRPFKLHRPRVWLRLMLPPLVVGFGAGLVIPFLNLYLRRKFSLSYGEVGTLFAFSSLATMGAMLVQPRLAARLGKVGAIVAVQVASLPFILALAYAPYLPLVTVALFIRGALMNAAGPVHTALSMELLAEEERAAYKLAEQGVNGLGWAAASSLSGALQARLGLGAFDYLFAATLGLYALASGLYVAYFGLRRPRLEPRPAGA